MPYKVHKLTDDTRNNTCGWFLPNGYYHVVEMTFENYDSLVNIGKKPNYSVDYISGETGFFDNNGNRYDPSAVYDVLVRHKEADIEPIGKKAKHSGNELEELRDACRRGGIAFHPMAGSAVLKKKLEAAKRVTQATLAVG